MTKHTKKKKKKGNASRNFKIFCYCNIALIVIAIISGIILRRERCQNSEEVRLFLPEGISYDAVIDTLINRKCISSREGFDAMSRLRRYKKHVKSGSYIVDAEMPYYDLVNKLRAGRQDPIKITIGSFRSLDGLCSKLGERFEFSGKELYAMVRNDSVCKSYGLDRQNMLAFFVQNTYEIYWNISVERFMERMYREYNHFWNASRLDKCAALNLSPAEVTTLAAIVEEETNNDKEKPLIASVYLNRIRKRMPLQADPTVRYAVGDFSLRRILKKHTEVNNPYNTYRFAGLPPGPICIPSAESIDAVLENRHTDYLYFCAKQDFSGSHNFASNLSEHQRNAEKFHKALNNRKIFK